MSLSDGLSAFTSFLLSLLQGWQYVINMIVNEGNWILILPVFTYIFVVITSSLRSMYKG